MRNRLLSMQQLLALFVAVIGIFALANMVRNTQDSYALYQKVAILQERKAALEADIARLDEQLAATEMPGWAELAVRKSLHWVRPDETLVVFRFESIESPEPQSRGDSFVENVTSHLQEWQAYLLGMHP